MKLYTIEDLTINLIGGESLLKLQGEDVSVCLEMTITAKYVDMKDRKFEYGHVFIQKSCVPLKNSYYTIDFLQFDVDTNLLKSDTMMVDIHASFYDGKILHFASFENTPDLMKYSELSKLNELNLEFEIYE